MTQPYQEKLEVFKDGLRDAMETTKKPVISTMTVLVILNYGVEFERVKNRLDAPDIVDFLAQVLGEDMFLYKKTSFTNSLIFKINKSIAVKLFCNGNIHITGVKTIEAALEISDIFCTLLELIDGDTGLTGTYQIMDYDIQLINFYYKIDLNQKSIINLCHLKNMLTLKTEYYNSYNNERHAGVIIKLIPITIIVFDSGNILLSGITKGEQLKEAFDFIDPFMAEHLKDKGALERKFEHLDDKIKKPKIDYVILK